jgi:hypothetical protein
MHEVEAQIKSDKDVIEIKKVSFDRYIAGVNRPYNKDDWPYKIYFRFYNIPESKTLVLK